MSVIPPVTYTLANRPWQHPATPNKVEYVVKDPSRPSGTRRWWASVTSPRGQELLDAMTTWSSGPPTACICTGCNLVLPRHGTCVNCF